MAEDGTILKRLLAVLDWGSFVFLTLSVILIILWFTVGGFRKVDGLSMYPYLHNKDIVILYKLAYRTELPKRGDVLVFKLEDGTRFVKRVIGLPGERVAIIGGHVYINGEPLDESAYLAETVYTSGGIYLQEGEEIVVPANHIFAMGDNRPHSTDSRDIGPVSLDAIEGKVLMVVFPFDRIKRVVNPFDHTTQGEADSISYHYR